MFIRIAIPSPRFRAAPIALTALLAAVAPADAGTWDLDRAAARAEKGFDALARAELDNAGDWFRSAVKAQPDYPASHTGLGHIAMIEKRFEDALAEYRLARAGYGALGESIRDLELKRYQTTQHLIAELRDREISAQRSVDGPAREARMLPPRGGMRPKRFGAESEAGRIERQRLGLADLIARLQAVQPPSGNASGEAPGEIDFCIGNALYHLGFIEEARVAWETCAAKSPSFALVQNNLAVLHSRQGRFAEARACFERAEALGLRVDPRAKADLDRIDPAP